MLRLNGNAANGYGDTACTDSTTTARLRLSAVTTAMSTVITAYGFKYGLRHGLRLRHGFTFGQQIATAIIICAINNLQQ